MNKIYAWINWQFPAQKRVRINISKALLMYNKYQFYAVMEILSKTYFRNQNIMWTVKEKLVLTRVIVASARKAIASVFLETQSCLNWSSWKMSNHDKQCVINSTSYSHDLASTGFFLSIKMFDPSKSVINYSPQRNETYTGTFIYWVIVILR